MPQCPQCLKPLREMMRRCPTCQADLDLLVDFVSHLQGGVERADSLVKAGELGQAVWAYLEVLETDPENVAARKQVGQVVTAVRQFDRSTPARRWSAGLPEERKPQQVWWWQIAFAVALVALVFCLGYLVGTAGRSSPGDPGPVPEKRGPAAPPNTLG